MDPKTNTQLGMLHSACMDLRIDPEADATNGRGQAFLAMSAKDARSVSARCFARWQWFPVLCSKDETLPRISKSLCWIGTEPPPRAVSPFACLSVLTGMRPVESLEEAEAILAWADANPEQLTFGRACYGVEALRAMVDGGELC